MRGATTPRYRRLVARILSISLVVGVCVGGVGLTSSASAATPPQLDLKVLLIGQGNDEPVTGAWQAALTSEGVPFDLAVASGSNGAMTVALPTLSDGSVGHYNGVVIAGSPTMFAAGALAPLFAYESAYGVRQLDGYMYPSPALGVTETSGGPLTAGTAAQLTPAGLALMPALKGPIPFDTGSYGYEATITANAPYTSILDAASGNTMAGIYQHPSTDAQAGVSELALNFNYNSSQLHWLLLAPGLINWVTQNTHLGLYRNYFGQDIDDVLIADNEWSSTYQCTPAATEPVDFTCPPGVVGNAADTPPDTLMSAADVDHVVAWQQSTGIRLNLAFNAVGACTGPTSSTSPVCTGKVTDGATTYTDPGFVVDTDAPDTRALTTALLNNKAQFNWIMHTWSHAFLGCNVWGSQALTSAQANAGGGTLAAGAYSYKITAATAYGESEPSDARTVTVAAGGSTTLTWPEASNGTGDTNNPGPSLAQEQATHTGGTGFWGYNIYRLDPGATATYGLVGQVAEASGATAATTYSFTDVGTAAGDAPESDSNFPTATNPGMGCTAKGWLSASAIQQEIGLDQAWAAANGFTSLPPAQYTQDAIVTGEHSGVENPNMPTALNAVGITTFAQDASRQPAQYSLGSAIGAPRYPSNIYYNASNWTDELNEYNTLYVESGTAFPGGTGHCVNTSSTTCKTTAATKADLLAAESHIILSHALANDPRVGYAHQPNLIGSSTPGEGYTLLDLLDNMLAQYNSWYTVPLTQLTDVSSAQILARQAAWTAAQSGGLVKASIQNGVVTVSNTGTSVKVPITVPTGTTVNGTAFGESYAGALSGWTAVGSTPLTLNEQVAPSILSAASASSIVGTPFSTTIVTTGAPAPALSVQGTLPAGITFTDNGNGTATIAGTSGNGTGGSYPVTITATNASGTDTQSFTLSNSEAPSITSPSTATFTTTVAGTYNVTTIGYPAATITESGTLPNGLTFAAAGDGTATISGTPATGSAGDYALTISATNASGSTATLGLSLTVNNAAAPVITSGPTAFFTLNQAGAAAVVTTGSPTPVISEIGALPAGLTFTPNANGTALISGTPTATGTSTLSITATNGVNPDATQTFTIIVGQAPGFTSQPAATFMAGSASSFQVTTSGYPAPGIGATGLPTGLTFTNNGDGTGTIAGTAVAAEVGDHNVSLTAVNGTGTASQTLVITVTAALAAPAAPVIGTATAGNASATVTWTAPAANGSPITGYSVKVVDSVTNAQIGALRPAAAGATSLVVTGLVNGTAVRFQVQATNGVGTGPFSDLSNAVTPGGAPGAPVIGTATVAGPTSATVTWTAPAAGGSAITGYSVRVLNSANAQVGALLPAAASATSLVVSGLTTGQTYHFTVTAANAIGTSAASASSNNVALTVPAAPVIGAASVASSTSAKVTWTAPAAGGSAITGYSVQVLNSSNVQVGALQPAAAGTTSLVVTGLTTYQTYHFTVTATNVIGTSAASASSNNVALTTPGTPVIGAASAASSTSANVAWSTPAAGGSPITGYSVKVLNTANAQVGALRTAAAGANSLVVTGLTAGQTYHFTVTAQNLVGSSLASASSNTVALVVSAAPTIGTPAAAGPTSATVRWNTPAAVAGAPITGYSVRVLSSANAQVGALRPAAAGTTSLVVTGLTTGAAYHFTVTATNAVGTSAASPSSATVTLAVPGTPGIAIAMPGAAGGAITATALWTAPAANAGPAITAYQVVAERFSAAGVVLATTTSANQPATARSLSMTLPVAGNYRFSVRAINIVGNGGLSARSNLVAGQ